MVKYMLTTKDNPYNPVTNFDQWLIFDSLKGYNSSQYLARIVETRDDMSEEEEAEAINKAIDEIIELDFMNIYTKVPFEEDRTMELADVVTDE